MQSLSLKQFIIICVILLCTVSILAMVNNVMQMVLAQVQMNEDVVMNGDQSMMGDSEGMKMGVDDGTCHFSINDYTEAEPTGFDETDMSGMRPAPIIPEAVPNQVADATGANFFVGKDGCDHQISP